MSSNEMDVSEVIVYNSGLSEEDKNKINTYYDLKWAIWGIKEKILCWLFPRQYPELVKIKNFRKGLICWIDASDKSTITKDGSDFVSKIDDKSGNGNHLVSKWKSKI